MHLRPESSLRRFRKCSVDGNAQRFEILARYD
jgi:hypothetical protein